MAERDWNWLKISKTGSNGQKGRKTAGNGLNVQNWTKYLELAENFLKQLEMASNGLNGWKWVEIAGEI